MIACNYDSTPTTDTNNDLCIYSTDLDACATCSGEQDGTGEIVDNDDDDDGICDEVDYDDGIGVNELVNVQINLYPNPSNDFINIDFDANLSNNVQLELLNAIGDVLLIKTVDEIAANNTIQIAINEMPDGLYFLKATVDGKVYSLPWVKK